MPSILGLFRVLSRIWKAQLTSDCFDFLHKFEKLSFQTLIHSNTFCNKESSTNFLVFLLSVFWGKSTPKLDQISKDPLLTLAEEFPPTNCECSFSFPHTNQREIGFPSLYFSSETEAAQVSFHVSLIAMPEQFSRFLVSYGLTKAIFCSNTAADLFRCPSSEKLWVEIRFNLYFSLAQSCFGWAILFIF